MFTTAFTEPALWVHALHIIPKLHGAFVAD
jgi:hypothetical protein